MADGILNRVSQNGFYGTLVLRVEQEKKFFGQISLEKYCVLLSAFRVKYEHIKGSEESCI